MIRGQLERTAERVGEFVSQYVHSTRSDKTVMDGMRLRFGHAWVVFEVRASHTT